MTELKFEIKVVLDGDSSDWNLRIQRLADIIGMMNGWPGFELKPLFDRHELSEAQRLQPIEQEVEQAWTDKAHDEAWDKMESEGEFQSMPKLEKLLTEPTVLDSPLVKETDPELEKLLAEEEEIEAEVKLIKRVKQIHLDMAYCPPEGRKFCHVCENDMNDLKFFGGMCQGCNEIFIHLAHTMEGSPSATDVYDFRVKQELPINID